MNETTSRARLAHGISAALAWTAAATLLALAPAGAAHASARMAAATASTDTTCSTQHHDCSFARMRLRLR